MSSNLDPNAGVFNNKDDFHIAPQRNDNGSNSINSSTNNNASRNSNVYQQTSGIVFIIRSLEKILKMASRKQLQLKAACKEVLGENLARTSAKKKERKMIRF